MLGPIEELPPLVVLALVALRFFEDACVVLELVLVLVHEVSASASAASAALACSAAVPAVPVVPVLVPVLVPALVELVELVLAELFSVAPAGSLGLVDDIGAEEAASAWLPEGLVHPPVGGLEQMEPPGQQKTSFAIVFSPMVPFRFFHLFPCLEDITHVTQVSESCNHFCEEGTTLLVHSHRTHKSCINHEVNRKLDKDGQSWTTSFLLVLSALQPQMCKVCCDFVRKSSLTSGHSAQARAACTMFSSTHFRKEASRRFLPINRIMIVWRSLALATSPRVSLPKQKEDVAPCSDLGPHLPINLLKCHAQIIAQRCHKEVPLDTSICCLRWR